MLLLEQYYFVNSLSIFLIFYVLFSLGLAPFGWVNLIDTILRLNDNDSLISRYAFFWTNFSYLPYFYFSLFLLYLLLRLSYKVLPYKVIILLPFTLYLNETLDLVSLNSNLWVSDLYYYSTNQLLLNNLNKYHPYIFYITTIILYTTLVNWLLNFYTNPSYNSLKSLTIASNKKLPLTFSYISVTLALGSWWALQEGSWGGWWDWDPSEMLGLWYLLLIFIIYHSNNSFTYLYTQVFVNKTLFVISLLLYYLIQLNFEFVSHNFGIKSFFLFNSNLIYLELITSLILCALFLLKSITKYFGNLNILESKNILLVSGVSHITKYNFKVIPFITIFLYYILSFIPLINYFNDNFWSIDTLALKNFVKIFNLIVIISFFMFFEPSIPFRKKTSLLITGMLLNPLVPKLFVNLGRITSEQIIHLILLIFFTINFVTVPTSLIYDSLDMPISTIITDKLNFYSSKFPSYTLNGVYFEYFTPYYNKTFVTLEWNFLYLQNISEINAFTLILNSSDIGTYYKLFGVWLTGGDFITFTGIQFFTVILCLFLFIVQYSTYKLIKSIY